MKKIVVLSTKRSTHHAFIESFLSGKDYFYENNLIKSGSDLVPGRVIKHGDAHDYRVLSFERGYEPSELLESQILKEKLEVDINKATVLVFIRDPINTLASTYSVYLEKLSQDKDFPKAYIFQNIKQYRKIMELVKKTNKGVVYIYANRFWNDSSYRDCLEDKLGLTFNVSDKVSKFAGGGHSFFGEKKITGKDVSSRFLMYVDDPFFVGLVKENIDLFKDFLTLEDDAGLVKKLKDHIDI